jgi:hypothetical protein
MVDFLEESQHSLQLVTSNDLVSDTSWLNAGQGAPGLRTRGHWFLERHKARSVLTNAIAHPPTMKAVAPRPGRNLLFRLDPAGVPSYSYVSGLSHLRDEGPGRFVSERMSCESSSC